MVIASIDIGFPGLNNSFTMRSASVLKAIWQSLSSLPVPVVSVSKKINMPTIFVVHRIWN
jgi:hypothetical protein